MDPPTTGAETMSECETVYMFRCTRCRYVERRTFGLQDRVIFNLRCPACTVGWLGGTQIIGRVTDTKCDARCMGATGPNCECSCGGKNHGAAHAV